jgi:hypothetical protein
MKKRNVWIAVVTFVVFVLSVLFIWRALSGQKSDEPTGGGELTESQKKLGQHLLELLTPPAATKEDWKRLKITAENLEEGEVPYWVLTNLKPVLEADTNTTAFHTFAANKRLENGNIVTTVWGHKIGNTLEIGWQQGKVKKQKRRTDNGVEFAEMHDDQRSGNNLDIGYGFQPPKYEKPGIAITALRKEDKQKKSCLIPYDHTPYMPVIGFITKNYPIGVMPLISEKAKKLESILVLDVEEGKILGKIKLPVEAKSGRPNFILDKENDVLLAVQFGLDWLVAIDLRPYVKKVGKK